MNKEYFTAQYNPATDEIIGCTPYSLIWWHERGHQSTRYLCLMSNATMLIGCAMAVIFAFFGILFKNFGLIEAAFICMFTWSFFRLYLEIWAWVYAFLHYRKHPHPLISDGT